jgi:hypothetical protein
MADGVDRAARLVDGREELLDDPVVRRFGFDGERRRFDEDDVRREETGERVPSSKPESCRFILVDSSFGGGRGLDGEIGRVTVREVEEEIGRSSIWEEWKVAASEAEVILEKDLLWKCVVRGWRCDFLEGDAIFRWM